MHFVVDRVRTVSNRKQCSNLLFLLFMFDILVVIRLSMTRQNLFMNTRKLSWKLHHSSENLNISRADRRRENFSSGKNYLVPGHFPRLIVTFKEHQNKNLLNSAKFYCIGVLLIFPCKECNIGAQFHMICCVLHFRIFQLTPFCSFFVKGSYTINRSLNCQINQPLLCTIFWINLHQYYKINMGREISVAYGFQTGHHYCGEQEIKVLCHLLSIKWSYMCAMGFEKLWLCSN